MLWHEAHSATEPHADRHPNPEQPACLAELLGVHLGCDRLRATIDYQSEVAVRSEDVVGSINIELPHRPGSAV